MSNKHEFQNSSSIQSCDYHDGESKLIIKFSSGAIYEYPNCDKAHYNALTQAASPGKHFHTVLRKLQSKKVSD